MLLLMHTSYRFYYVLSKQNVILKCNYSASTESSKRENHLFKLVIVFNPWEKSLSKPEFYCLLYCQPWLQTLDPSLGFRFQIKFILSLLVIYLGYKGLLDLTQSWRQTLVWQYINDTLLTLSYNLIEFNEFE